MLKFITNLVPISLLFCFSCQGQTQLNEDVGETLTQVTYQDVVTRFDENDLDYVVLPLQGEAVLVISEYGGRVLGPFPSKSEASIYWLNRAFTDKLAFKEILEEKDLMIGGERIWMAPEIQYNVPDRSEFWSSYAVPDAVDPGDYQIKLTESGECNLSQSMVLKAHNISQGKKELLLHRTIRKANNPLRYLKKQAELMRDVVFMGYEHQIDLSEGEANDIMSEAWDLVQLNTPGRMIIPSSPLLEYTNYYDPMPEDYHTKGDHYNEFKVTGKRQYKIGLKAAHVLGRPSYFSHLPDGRAYLIICNFFNNPSSIYSEEPAHLDGTKGHSFHIYDDDGRFGGFAELECNGQTIGGSSGKSATSDQLVFWIYIGEDEKVKRIAYHLLGISP